MNAACLWTPGSGGVAGGATETMGSAGTPGSGGVAGGATKTMGSAGTTGWISMDMVQEGVNRTYDSV